MSIARTRNLLRLFIMLAVLMGTGTSCMNSIGPKADATSIPKVELVYPLEDDPLQKESAVFFTENFENPESFDHTGDLGARFYDTGGTSEDRLNTSEDRLNTSEDQTPLSGAEAIRDNKGVLMRISYADAFSGSRSAQNTYLPKHEFPVGDDPGSAGWFWYFFGDNELEGYSPISDTVARTRLFARWYHKFEEGFSSQDSTGTLPPKMARMRCFDKTWRANYTVLFWIEGADGHISIQQHTRAPGVEREWRPNYHTSFLLNNPGNLGRWIHFELGVTLGEGHFSDRVQAWADGILICDIDKQDLAGGYRGNTLNGMSWDCYWNGGSPRAQSRFYDDLVLSDKPIGPARTSLTPCIRKAAFVSENAEVLKEGQEKDLKEGQVEDLEEEESEDLKNGLGKDLKEWHGEDLEEWQVEVAQTRQIPVSLEDPGRRAPKMQYATVWMGEVDGKADTVRINKDQGSFTGPLKGREQLEYNTLYSVRLRQRAKKSEWSEWSDWHSAFSTLREPGADSEEGALPEGYLAGHTVYDQGKMKRNN